MALSNDDVLNLLFHEVGETGNAEVRQDGGLYIQREDNGSWGFYGVVEDPAGAQGVLHDFFS